MKINTLRSTFVVLAGTLTLFGGCSCHTIPSAPEKPDLDASAAGAGALEKYDTNNDGKLDAKELEQSPPLKVAKKRIDTDGDGALTAEEISDRVTAWENGGTTLFLASSIVTLNGKDLEGATVTFEPEEFLQPGLTACSGVTDKIGNVAPSGADPEHSGIHYGLYRVKISKMENGKETIPAKYNTQTILGYEAAEDIMSDSSDYSAADFEGVGELRFDLRVP